MLKKRFFSLLNVLLSEQANVYPNHLKEFPTVYLLQEKHISWPPFACTKPYISIYVSFISIFGSLSTYVVVLMLIFAPTRTRGTKKKKKKKFPA